MKDVNVTDVIMESTEETRPQGEDTLPETLSQPPTGGRPQRQVQSNYRPSGECFYCGGTFTGPDSRIACTNEDCDRLFHKKCLRELGNKVPTVTQRQRNWECPLCATLDEDEDAEDDTDQGDGDSELHVSEGKDQGKDTQEKGTKAKNSNKAPKTKKVTFEAAGADDGTATLVDYEDRAHYARLQRHKGRGTDDPHLQNAYRRQRQRGDGSEVGDTDHLSDICDRPNHNRKQDDHHGGKRGTKSVKAARRDLQAAKVIEVLDSSSNSEDEHQWCVNRNLRTTRGRGRGLLARLTGGAPRMTTAGVLNRFKHDPNVRRVHKKTSSSTNLDEEIAAGATYNEMLDAEEELERRLQEEEFERSKRKNNKRSKGHRKGKKRKDTSSSSSSTSSDETTSSDSEEDTSTSTDTDDSPSSSSSSSTSSESESTSSDDNIRSNRKKSTASRKHRHHGRHGSHHGRRRCKRCDKSGRKAQCDSADISDGTAEEESRVKKRTKNYGPTFSVFMGASAKKGGIPDEARVHDYLRVQRKMKERCRKRCCHKACQRAAKRITRIIKMARRVRAHHDWSTTSSVIKEAIASFQRRSKQLIPALRPEDAQLVLTARANRLPTFIKRTTGGPDSEGGGAGKKPCLNCELRGKPTAAHTTMQCPHTSEGEWMLPCRDKRCKANQAVHPQRAGHCPYKQAPPATTAPRSG